LFAVLASTSTAFASSGPAAAPGPWHDVVGQTNVLDAGTAQAVSPDFTCPSRTICLFPNDDYTGNYGSSPVILVPAGTTSGVWCSFNTIGADSPHPGSMNNNSGSSIWVYDHQAGPSAGNPVCLSKGRHVLDHSYGYFELFYSDSDCAHQFTRPLP